MARRRADALGLPSADSAPSRYGLQHDWARATVYTIPHTRWTAETFRTYHAALFANATTYRQTG